MTDLKLSDLVAATTVATTDLVGISQDLGGGSYISKKVEFNKFAASVDQSEPSTVHVSKNGNDSTADGSITYPFLTIKAALASITDNDATHRYNIYVDVGIYVELNPILYTFSDIYYVEWSVVYEAGAPVKKLYTRFRLNPYNVGGSGIELELAVSDTIEIEIM